MDEATLIQKIVASLTFRTSDQLGPLLQFLYENQHRRIRSTEIETDHFKHPEPSSVFDTGRARERVMSLKKLLEKYSVESPDDDLVCSLSDGRDGQGYFPKFKKVKPGSIATSNFWESHFGKGNEASVVCDSLLFFYEHQQGRMLRYVDTNIEGINRLEAREKLNTLHEAHAKENLLAGHFYIDVGAVLAAETLREHFWKVWERRVPFAIEKEEPKQAWTEGSPILIGTPRTNTYMKRIFNAKDADFGFRLHDDRFSWVTVKDPSSEGLKRLKKLKSGLHWSDNANFTTTTPELTLGIVTRIPNPIGGGRTVTFISSDATRNATQMAVALTNEHQLRQVFDQMKWPYSRPLPERFQLLFKVTLWPANLDDRASVAELVSWKMPVSEQALSEPD